MSFYSPFQKGPDWGQGISDMSSQIMQMMMLKKMFGDKKNNPIENTPLPPAGQGSRPAEYDQLAAGANQGASAMAGQSQDLTSDPAVMSDIIKRILAGMPGILGK